MKNVLKRVVVCGMVMMASIMPAQVFAMTADKPSGRFLFQCG